MEFFQTLGDTLNHRWLEQGGNEEIFPALAAEALREFDAPSRLTCEEILHGILQAETLPKQIATEDQIPVTLYWSERFAIYALIWVDGTTTIHDHSAWGAFQVVSGSSLHARYTFEEKERISAYTAVGDLKLAHLETLKAGDVREVQIGRSFIHSLFHLDRPSVTIAIFTKSPPHYASLYSYRKPGFAYVSRFEEQRLRRQLIALEIVHQTRPEHYERAVTRFVAKWDSMYAYRALDQALSILPEDAFERVVEATRVRHPRLTDLWREAFREVRRQNNIKERRAFVHDAEHRFFLAAVLNAPQREDVFRLVKERVPDRDPVDTIVKWVEDLAQVPIAGPAGPTAIGPPIDEAGLVVLRALLRGRDTGGVIEEMKAVFDAREVDAQVSDIVDLVNAFRESLFFAPLLPARAK